MEARTYSAANREACLAVLDSLDLENRAAFEQFLDAPPPFYVLEHDGAILGCGGFSISPDGARLEWGMIHRAWQRQGLGRFLLFYRLKEISKAGNIAMVSATVPPKAIRFFESQGFRLASTGIGGVLVQKKLAVCT